MRISEWAEANRNGTWSDNWKDKDGESIACPKCGCNVVSPVGTSEFFSYVNEIKHDTQKENHEKAIHYYLSDALAFEAEEYPNEIKDPKNINHLKEFHKKNGIFCCGNEDCFHDEESAYFSPRSKPNKITDNDRVWNEENKRNFGWNNPWDIGLNITKIPKKKDGVVESSKDFW